MTLYNALTGLLDNFALQPLTWPALMGNGAGVVIVPNMPGFVYVRQTGSEAVVKAYNERVPIAYDQPVVVGYDILNPTLFQVLSIRHVYNGVTGVAAIPNHHNTHEWLGNDTVFSDARQFLPLRISASGLVVRVYTSIYNAADGWQKCTELADLTALVPVSGACYVLLALNSDGALQARAGTAQATRGDLKPEHIPALLAGEYPLAAVVLYAGQTSILETTASQDVVDLRFSGQNNAGHVFGSGSAGQVTYWVSSGSVSGSAGLTFTAATNTLGVDNVQWDTTPAVSTPAEGRMYWNSADGTLNLGMPGGNVNLQIGQETLIRIQNDSGGTLLNGELVYVSGASGSNVKVKKAQANAENTSAQTIAMMTEDVNDNQHGYATAFGAVRDINTALYSAGTMLYLSAGSAGKFTDTPPTAPNHTVVVGYVVRQHASAGVVFVSINNGWELSELHDVAISGSPANGQILSYSSSGSAWTNTSASSLGFVSGSGSAGQVAVWSSGSAISGSAALPLANLPAHKSTHASGGSDALSTADIGAVSGTGTANYMAYWSGSGAIAGDSAIQRATGGKIILNGGATYLNNVIYIGGTGDAKGAVDASAGFFAMGTNGGDTLGGAYIVMRSNLYSQLSNQRGYAFFTSGSPSTPLAGNDGVMLINGVNYISLSTGNVSEAVRIDSNKTMRLITGTAPSTSPADAVQMYSADVNGAGDAGLKIRTEGGDIYQMGDYMATPGGRRRTLATKTTAYTLTANDDIILANHASTPFTLTLPAAATFTGQHYTIKNIGAAAVTIDGNGSETIDGELTQTIRQWNSIDIVCNGSAWFII